MDNNVIIRQRALHCRGQVLECFMNGIAKPELLAEKSCLVLRFLPFERELLEQSLMRSPLSRLPRAFENSKRITNLARAIFFRWSWAFDVLRQFLTELQPENIQHPRVQTIHKAVEQALSLLRAKKVGDLANLRAKRTKLLLADNAQLHTETSRSELVYDLVNVRPHTDDLRIWKLLAVAYEIKIYEIDSWIGCRAVADDLTAVETYLVQGDTDGEGVATDVPGYLTTTDTPPTETEVTINEMGSPEAVNQTENTVEQVVLDFVDKLIDSEDTIEIWRLSRTMRLAQARPHNEADITTITLSKEFDQAWKLNEFHQEESDLDSSSSVKAFITRQPFSETRSSLHSTFFESSFSEKLSISYHKRKHELALEPLHHYLEYIPMDELTAVGSNLANERLSELNLVNETLTKTVCKLWIPPESHHVNHSFYIAEDIYSYFLQPGFDLPGHESNGSVILLMTPIDDTTFCGDLRSFWAKWNDCAITYDPRELTVYLLETIPGRKARSLPQAFYNDGVRNYFQSFIFSKRKGHVYNSSISSNEAMLKELLGDQYNRSFEHFLRYIDPTNLVPVRSQDLIGQGSFGRVYKGWCRSLPSDTADFEDLREGSVAIKVAFDLDKQTLQKSSSKFFHELYTLLFALSGTSIGFIEFYGVTQVDVDNTGRIYSEPHASTAAPVTMDDRRSVLALVFDFADKGSALDFLQGTLREDEFKSNWQVVCAGINSFALGLSTIHEQGVLHRDIHPNNVLVKKRFHDDPDSSEVFLLADLGEGKNTQKSVERCGATLLSGGGQKFINTSSYLAPEVARQGFSKASDVFAFAQTCFDMIRFNDERLSTEYEGVKQLLIPTKLLGILHACVHGVAEERLEAWQIVKMMDEVEKDIRRDQAQWFKGYDFGAPQRSKQDSGSMSIPSSLEDM